MKALFVAAIFTIITGTSTWASTYTVSLKAMNAADEAIGNACLTGGIDYDLVWAKREPVEIDQGQRDWYWTLSYEATNSDDRFRMGSVEVQVIELGIQNPNVTQFRVVSLQSTRGLCDQWNDN